MKLAIKVVHPFILAALLTAPACPGAQQYVISTFAGGAMPPTPATGTNYTIGNPSDLTTDSAGNLYFVSLNCVFKLDPNDILTRIAGTGAGGYSGDGGLAINAKLFNPRGIAVDTSGNSYVADTSNYRIRRISSAGIITTVAGNGTYGYSGDDGPAVFAHLTNPAGVAVDSAGNLYIFDAARIRKVMPNGMISTIAGGAQSGFTGDGGPAIQAQITPGNGIAVDRAGNLYIVDTPNQRIRKIGVDGNIATIAGSTSLVPGGTSVSTGDGGPAVQAELNMPRDVAVDSAGNIFIAEANRIRVVSNGIITSAPGGTGPANDPFVGVNSIALDGSGNIEVADVTSRIRKLSSSGAVSVIAGPQGSLTFPVSQPATTESFSSSAAVAADAAGNVVIADTGNSWIWWVSPSGKVTVVGHETKPTAIAVDNAGNYYVASNGQIWQAHYSGSVPPAPVAVAGGGSSTADGISALSAQLTAIGGVAVDTSGNIFIADLPTSRIRKVTPAGIITTAAGTGVSGFSGDGGQATAAKLSAPRGIAVDGAGNLYIADSGNYRIRQVSPNGVINTVAGGAPVVDSWVSLGDGGPATSAALLLPFGVAVDAAGDLFIADEGRIREVSNGIINTIAGNGTQGYYGDGGVATLAALNSAVGVAVDSNGNVYVDDQGNNVIRLLEPTNAPVLISAVLDAATESPIPVTPGKIIVIYGAGLGPATIASNAPNNGAFGTQVGGTTVTFNGVSAPMIYASSTQVSAIVPYEIAGTASANVVVNSSSGVSAAFSVSVAAAAPSFFSRDGTGAGQIAAVNLDGSLNDPSSPVKPGDYISLYATGEGQTFPPGVDGALANSVYPKPVLPVTVTVGGEIVSPAYAGAAPTEVLGLMQIVVQIPKDVQPGGYVPVQLQVGNSSTVSGASWIAVAGN